MSRIRNATLAIVTVTVTVTVLLLGACSSPEPVPLPEGTVEGESGIEQAPAEPAIEACGLLDGVDVAALLAEEPGTPEEGSGQCTIKPADASSPASLVLQVISGANGAAYYERDKELLGVSSEIPDLGDEAYFAGKRVNVLVSETYLYLQVLRNPVGGAGQADDAALLDATATVLANGGW